MPLSRMGFFKFLDCTFDFSNWIVAIQLADEQELKHCAIK